MKPLISIDYTVNRMHKTPRFTVKSPVPGLAIRYSINTPVNETSPVYMKATPISFGDIVYAMLYSGKDPKGEMSSAQCIDPVVHHASKVETSSISRKPENIVVEDLGNMVSSEPPPQMSTVGSQPTSLTPNRPATPGKPDFDGTWGSADW